MESVMSKPFASSADTHHQKARLVELAPDVYGYISDFDPNTGMIFGGGEGLAIDCRATPRLANEMLIEIKQVNSAPITRLFLTHYHAVRVMGRAAFTDVHTVLCSEGTRALIDERGAFDFESEVRRFPRLFEAVEEVEGLTWPDQTFPQRTILYMGDQEIHLEHLGSGHTRGDSVAWLPEHRVLFSGDLIEDRCALYCGDAYLHEWRETLERLAARNARVVVPGRGDAIIGEENVRKAIDSTRGFLDDLLGGCDRAMQKKDATLKEIFDAVYAEMTPKYGEWPIYEHCIPFNVSRAVDELKGLKEPSIWTAERDAELWEALQS
ncbi:MAG: MBL fold metallo-hydrolase [Deltaproteobacteria bacterium]|nr:MBL fold metallo-hydrolase [Deltaproteobacteria bacterium]MBU49770.1 MBL fold metallo-hydrolase [Deltaproteobacteria bacterium]MBU54574.1 MBL fold metallo-hydrolase [Deltaproteobacteria bacterium]|tara:strand:+ start:1093 stop:2061 length:969 start_codon:yes stop_codon:yes gene_type:complete